MTRHQAASVKVKVRPLKKLRDAALKYRPQQIKQKGLASELTFSFTKP